MINIKFGAGHSVTRDKNGYDTIEDIINDDALRTVMGFGDNVEAYINDLLAHDDTPVQDDDTIKLVTKANCKA